MSESATAKIIRLQEQMKKVDEKVDELKLNIDKILNKVDALNSLYDEVNMIKLEVKRQQFELDKLEKKINFQRWLFPTLSAMVGGIFLWLVQQVLNK